MLELILYNPFAWVAIILVVGIFLSWFYWWCKHTFKFEGSWKNLDKTINWREDD